jgi:hypothetical protein
MWDFNRNVGGKLLWRFDGIFLEIVLQVVGFFGLDFSISWQLGGYF